MQLLIAATPTPIGEVVGRVKSTTSSSVLKLPANRQRRRTWTAAYWKVHFFDAGGLSAVPQYNEAHNLRRNRPARRFDFIRPLPV